MRLLFVFVVFLTGLGCPGAGSEVDTKRSFTRLELAKDYLRKGEYEGAHQEARSALRFDRGNESAYNVLGLVEYFRALDNFRLVEIRDCLTGVDAQVLRQEFESHLDKAAGYFAKATKMDPNYGEAWSNAGVVALQLGEHNAAITHLREALKYPARLDNIAVTRANLGWAHFHKGEHVRAAKELRQSLQFQQQMCVASYRLGRVYFARKEWEKAVERFTKVGSLNCPIQEAHLYLMKTLAALNQLDRLEEVRRSCVAMAPRSCVAAQCRTMVP